MKKSAQSLEKQLTYLVFIACVAFGILLFVFDYYSISRYRDQIIQNEIQAFKNMIRDTESDMRNVDNTLSMLFLDSVDFNSLSQNKDNLKSYNAAYNLDNMLKSSLLAESSFKGYLILYDGAEKTRYYFDHDMEFDEKISVVDMIRAQITPMINTNRWMLVQTSDNIYYVKVLQKRYGTVAGIVGLSYYQAKNQISVKNKEYILVKNGEVLTGKELAEKIGLEEFAGNADVETSWKNGYYITKKDVGSSELMLYMVFEDSIVDYLKLPQLLMISLSLLALFFVAFLMNHLKKKMICSLLELRNTMQQIRDNNWEIEIPENACFMEIQNVNEMFRQMMEQIRFFKINSYEERLKKQKAELTYLQLQIRPHFYLNCLKTMNAMIVEKKYDKIQDLIFSISMHMRYLLKVEKDLSTMKEEIEYAKNYLNLQNDLRDQEVVCEWDIQESLLEIEIPLLTIQTFLENSFKYYRPRNKKETLHLEIRGIRLVAEEGDFCDLMIRDNGSGYPDEVLAVINGEVVNHEVGVGITNLKNRCEIIYHGKAEYNFYNSEGAVSELVLPIEKRSLKNRGDFDECNCGG